MLCPKCTKRFNLTSRQPYIMKCCLETCCKACFEEKDESSEEVKCLYCEEKTRNGGVNKQVLALLEKEISSIPKLSVICDSHPTELSQYISKKDGTMLCSKCLIEKHQKMVKNCKQLDAEQMF